MVLFEMEPSWVSDLREEHRQMQVRISDLERQNRRLVSELEDMEQENQYPTWPEWATECLHIIRLYSGYDGYDDWDGVDLPQELADSISEYRGWLASLKKTIEQGEKK